MHVRVSWPLVSLLFHWGERWAGPSLSCQIGRHTVGYVGRTGLLHLWHAEGLRSSLSRHSAVLDRGVCVWGVCGCVDNSGACAFAGPF